MSSPFFKDPHAQALAQAGIVHRPGLAKQMLDDLAPLLAAEGVDLNAFDGNIDTLNAALARASERHNFELFTPTGPHLSGAIVVLGAFALALIDGDQARATAILGSVNPDPDQDWPAISHVIGAGLGRLDSWGRSPDLRPIFANAKAARWSDGSTRAARKILTLARNGRAFDAIDDLHRTWSGLDIYEGTALAIAAFIKAASSKWRVVAPDACDRLLPAVNTSAADILEARIADVPMLDAFEDWLSEKLREDEDLDDEDIDHVDATVDTLATVFWIARGFGIDPHDAASVPVLTDALVRVYGPTDDEDDGFGTEAGITGIAPLGRDEDPDADESDGIEILVSLLEVLDDYVHFRTETDPDPEAWDAAHDAVSDAMTAAEPGISQLLDALEAIEDASPQECEAALALSPIVTAVPALLSWIGRGRQVSPSGNLRRANIRAVAALLGISAVGVNSRRQQGRPGAQEPPAQETLGLAIPDDDSAGEAPELAVLSMTEIPTLATWWEALAVTGIIDLTSGRVRPGPDAAGWSDASVIPLDSAQMLVATFMSTLITQSVSDTSPLFARVIASGAATLTIVRLLHAAAPGIDIRDVEDGLFAIDDSILSPTADAHLREFTRLHLISLGDDGTIGIPKASLKNTARAMLLALTMLGLTHPDSA